MPLTSALNRPMPGSRRRATGKLSSRSTHTRQPPGCSGASKMAKKRTYLAAETSDPPIVIFRSHLPLVSLVSMASMASMMSTMALMTPESPYQPSHSDLLSRTNQESSRILLTPIVSHSQIPRHICPTHLHGHDGLLLPVPAAADLDAHEHAQVRPDRYETPRNSKLHLFLGVCCEGLQRLCAVLVS